MKPNQIITTETTPQSQNTGESGSQNRRQENIKEIDAEEKVQQPNNSFVPKSILSVKGSKIKAQTKSYVAPDKLQTNDPDCNQCNNDNKQQPQQLKQGKKFFRKISFLSKIGLNKSSKSDSSLEVVVAKTLCDKPNSWDFEKTVSTHCRKQSKISEAAPDCLDDDVSSKLQSEKAEQSSFSKVSFKQHQTREKEFVVESDINCIDNENCKLSSVPDSVMNHVVESLLLNATIDPSEPDYRYPQYPPQPTSSLSPITDLSSPIDPPQQFQTNSQQYCNVDISDLDHSGLYRQPYNEPRSYLNTIQQPSSPITMYDHMNGSISIPPSHHNLGSCSASGSESTICGPIVDEIVDDRSSPSTIIYNNQNPSNGTNNSNNSHNNVTNVCIDGSRTSSSNNSPKLNQSKRLAKNTTNNGGLSICTNQQSQQQQSVSDSHNPNSNNVFSFVDINDIDHNYYRLLQLQHQNFPLSAYSNILGSGSTPNLHNNQPQPLPYSPYAAAAAAAYLRSTNHYFSNNSNNNPTVISDSQNFNSQQQQLLPNLPPIHHHSTAAQLLYIPSPATAVASSPILGHMNLNQKNLLNSNPSFSNISQPPLETHKTNCVGSNYPQLAQAGNDSLSSNKLPPPLQLSSSSPSSAYHHQSSHHFLCAEHKPLNGLMMDPQYCPASADLQSSAMIYHNQNSPSHPQQQSRKGVDPRHHHHHHHLHQFPISANPTNRYNQHHHQQQQQNLLLSTSTATSGATGIKLPLYATLNSNKNRIESATIGANSNYRTNSHLIRPTNIDFCHNTNMPIPATITTTIASSNNQRTRTQLPANINGTPVPTSCHNNNQAIENPYQRPKFNMQQSMNRDQNNNNSNFEQLQQQQTSEANMREMKGYEASSQYLPMSDKQYPFMNGANTAMFDGGFAGNAGCHSGAMPRYSTDAGTSNSADKRNCSQWRMTLFVFYWIIWIVFLIGVVIIVAANARHAGIGSQKEKTVIITKSKE